MSDKRTTEWESELPLFGPEVSWQWTAAMVATAAVMLVLLGTIFAAQGDWEALRGVSGIVVAAVTGLWLFGFAVMAILYRGRYRVRYTLSDKGVLCESVEPVARRVNRLAILVGALSGKPGLLGAGLIGSAREAEQVPWDAAVTAVAKPTRHLVILRNRWRTVMFVQCTPDNYAEVAEIVAQRMAGRGTAPGKASRSPLPMALLHSALVALAGIVLIRVADAYDIGLFVPILLLCFGLATVWLVNLFGYVVMAGIAYMALFVTADMVGMQQSYLFPGKTYRGYEMVGTDDLEILSLGTLASVYLVWLSLRAVRGRLLAVLQSDMGESGRE